MAKIRVFDDHTGEMKVKPMPPKKKVKTTIKKKGKK